MAAGLLVLLAQPAAPQDDVAGFRLTDMSGEFAVRYRLDGWRDAYVGGEETFVETPTWEERLYVRTRSYVYHPAFLTMDVGGGPLLVQYGYESDQGDNDGSETLFNFDANLGFLERKAYPFSLHYRLDHPEIVSGLSGRFLATLEEYGARGMLRQPISPMSIAWEADHSTSDGSGFGTVVSEDIDRAGLRGELPYRSDDRLRWRLDWNDRRSASGSPGLPIQASKITTTSADLYGTNQFGSAGGVQLRQSAVWYRQDVENAAKTRTDTLTYAGTLDWRQSESLRSFGSLRYQDVDRTNSWSRSGDARGGVVWQTSPGLRLSGEAGYAQDDAPGFARDTTGGRATLDYTRPLSFGSLGAGGYVALDRTDQQSDAATVSIFDEPVVLVGTTPVPLSRPFLVPGSVEVTNEPKTQTFVEGVDYRLVTVGSTTTIERLLGGSIEDGQTVLVSYDVLTGGTVKYDTSSHGLSANLALLRYFNLFVLYGDVRNDVTDGTPTTPLNDVNRIEYGARADYPFTSGWSVGGEYRHTNQDEDISPYISDRYDAYIQSAVYFRSRARASVSHGTVNYEESVEDSNLWRYALGLVSRLPGGLLLSYTGEYSEDDGGTLPWDERRHVLRLDWGYRQVRFTLRADRSERTQGGYRRENTRMTAELRREF